MVLGVRPVAWDVCLKGPGFGQIFQKVAGFRSPWAEGKPVLMFVCWCGLAMSKITVSSIKLLTMKATIVITPGCSES